MLNTTEHIHFIGIGGYGMSAIACVLQEMGYMVTGSDVAEQDLTEKLRQKGVTVHIGHDSAYVRNADTVVYSTACPKDNIERVMAEQLGIPVIHRSQMLAHLLNAKKGIAIAGAHGKTTTSSMIAFIMERCGMDPTYIIGGEVMNLGTNAQAGKSEYIVAEADESDGSFLNYHPHIAVVLNIEADHLENYAGSFEQLKEAYMQFLSQVTADGCLVLCTDDPIIASMLPDLDTEIVTYGIEQMADYTATDIVAQHCGMSFTMNYQGQALGAVRLSVPGVHNVLNAMATIIVSLRAGIPFAQAAAAMIDFIGAKRRFQVIGEERDVLVIDDYAHHPTEIKATLEAAKALNRRIVAVFQPQRYSRTHFLFDQFSHAFMGADELILTDIYSPVGEQPIEGIHSSKLVDRIRENSNRNAQYIPDKYEALKHLKLMVKEGDLVITMGAGDIWKTACGLVDVLK